ncbi:MAG: hypothetical protein KC438_03700 [Thermomicrobiales bacterium]|nr:hypothetical protein [Thermomicrobiales bacterium]MCO5220079.1 site-2 protease family protein [Thermomicrobiales bacterium]
MPLGGFGLISLFYLFLGVRFLFQFIPRRKQIFDSNFTPYDRSMLGQAAFFLLLPISVALHELGHAVAIWLMGGKVLDFGFFFFSGYVSYDPRGFSAVQQTLVAFAGTFVNLVLIVVAVAVVFLKRPPLRAPWNELLLQFVFISGINTLVFYPAIDLLLDISGDWSQMYQSGIPWLTAVIVVIQVGFIAAGVWGMRNPGMRDRIAKLTGLPSGSSLRMSLGAYQNQQASSTTRIAPAQLTGNDKIVANAVERVAAGWTHRATTRTDRGSGGTVASLIWQSGEATRTIAVVLRQSGETALVGNVHSLQDPAAPANQKLIRSWPALPSEDDLTMAIRIAAERVDTWTVGS